MYLKHLVGAAIVLIAASPSLADQRIALVIGNSTYQTAGKIDNPVHDADDLGKALSGLGFAVTVVDNATRADMEAAMGTFDRRL